MIDGLKLTMTGARIQELLAERIEWHRRVAKHWKREAKRTPEQQTDEEPCLPTHICENEVEEQEWRISVLEFLSAHLERGEVYRVSERDLQFGELLPQKPGWMEQSEYERENAVGFWLEQLTKEVRRSGYRFDVLDMPPLTRRPAKKRTAARASGKRRPTRSHT